MSYMTEHAKTPRATTLTLRLSAAGLAHIDKARGTWTRSEYVRRALLAAARDNLTGPR